MTPTELYQAGKLGDAIDAALSEVKKKPTEVTSRYFLTELLCFQGDLERADKQLDVLNQQALDAAVQVILLRHLVRAETARQQFYNEGALPDFLFDVSPSMRNRLDALIAIRESKDDEAVRLLNEAESTRPKVSGTCNDQSFDDFRDLDDFCGGFLEVLTSTGKFYLVPIETIETLEFSAPRRPIDLLWRETQINVTNGPEGLVYVPTIYAHTAQESDDQLRLGRGTDWVGEEAVRGRGLRTFLVGEEDMTVMQINKMTFERSDS